MPLLQLLSALLATARSSLKSQHVLALANLALRQQLAILRRRTKRTPADQDRPRILGGPVVPVDRLAGHPERREAPNRHRAWHRMGFKLYWAWKSRNKGGRPRVDVTIRRLGEELGVLSRQAPDASPNAI